ncbi:hypothetical protein [Streptomyces sp. NPDC006784]|uniref:hypothetical protein n=1 Tax=Streptomyces sp. NPDC006784 TaxID=3364764 RepID=UPI00368C6BF5
MTEEEVVTRLRSAVRSHKRAKEGEARAREDLSEAIAAALRAGMRPRDVAAETGYTAEHVRRIAREHNVPRLREPTVTSKRKQGDTSA